MPNRTRRNIANKHNKSGHPYNEIWDAFYPILEPIFADRLAEGKRSKLYVPVPDTEQRIDEYVNSDSNQVAILHGLMGAGKSTILENYANQRNDNFKRYLSYLNFQGRRYHLVPDIEHLSLTRADRRLAARTMVTKRLNHLLLPFIQANISYVNINFFEFLKKNFPAEIGSKALFARTESEKLTALHDFMGDADQTAPIQCFIMYMAIQNQYDEFTVLVDNVDEQSFEIVEGLFFALSDFLDCLMRPRRRAITNNRDSPDALISETLFSHSIRFRAILACRSHTLEALRDDHEGILHTRGFDEIELKGNSLLSAILKRRVQSVKETSEAGPDSSRALRSARYTLKSGMVVQRSDALEFVDTFISKLATASVESDLFDLFNHNYAKAIKNIKYVVQNRYFVSYDAEILSKGELRPDFHYVRVLKALSYGNPPTPDRLYYPSKSSVVPNLFFWDPDRDDTFLLVLRFLKWIQKSYELGGHGGSIADGIRIKNCLAEYSTKMGTSRESLYWAIRYCHANGLIFSDSGYESSLSESECVSLSPRGSMAVSLAFRDIALFEITIDDIPAPNWQKTILDGRPPVVQHDTYPKRAHFQDTFGWLQMFLDGERRGFESLRKNEKDPNALLKLFDGKLISELLAGALKFSFQKYYSNVCTQADKSDLNKFLDRCRDARRFYSTV